MSDSSFSWSVELPSRGARPAGGRRARAELRISSGVGGDELLTVPVPVGRRLADLSKSDTGPASRAELLYRLGEASRSCAHARMEELVGRRDYSAHELSSRLLEDGYSHAVVESVVGRAREVGVVDDARFGAAFARAKVLSGWGRMKIERELRRRGVDPLDVPGWPEEFATEDEERERALSLASRRRLSGKNDYQKIARFLCARGFSPGLATSVTREVLAGDSEAR